MLSRRSALSALVAPVLYGQKASPKMFGDAEAYERFMGRWSRMLAPLLVEFTRTRDSGQVLDIGSGTGVLAQTIATAKAHCRVIGIDPSKEYVEFASRRNQFPDRVTFEVGDAQSLRFGDGTFESSLALLVFNFIPDPPKALSEARRVTSPGGSIGAAVWDYTGGMRMLRVFWEAAGTVDANARDADELHMRLCRAGELQKLWKDSGLQDVVEQPLDITMRFESLDDYWKPFLLGQGPAGAYVRRLNAKQQSALRAELNRRLTNGAEDKPFSLPARAWAVRGTVPERHH